MFSVICEQWLISTSRYFNSLRVYWTPFLTILKFQEMVEIKVKNKNGCSINADAIVCEISAENAPRKFKNKLSISLSSIKYLELVRKFGKGWGPSWSSQSSTFHEMLENRCSLPHH